jgi:hypothetical protein
MKKMKMKITMEHMACSRLGRRHDQSLCTLLVNTSPFAEQIKLTDLDGKCSIGDPTCDKRARMVTGTGECDQDRAVLRMGDFSNQKRSRTQDNGIAKS